MNQRKRLGMELANIRRQRGLSQVELAKKADVSRNTIVGIEQGESVTSAMLEAVANALDVNLIALKKEVTYDI